VAGLKLYTTTDGGNGGSEERGKNGGRATKSPRGAKMVGNSTKPSSYTRVQHTHVKLHMSTWHIRTH